MTGVDGAPPVRRSLWLLGDARISASPSPRLHDAVFGDGAYALHPTDDAEAGFSAAEGTCRGVNVTAPFKVFAAARYASVLDDRARLTGAVNTVVFDDSGRARGAANTDVEGLLVAWRRAGFLLEGRTLAVVGAGGAARAVAVAAAETGVKRLVAHARRPEAAAAIVETALRAGVEAGVASATGDDRGDVVVVAASDVDVPAQWLARTLRPGGCVHDLRYGGRAVAVRDAALRAGARFADGTTMLLAQAEGAAALFAGRPLSVGERERMRAALASWLRCLR